MAQKRGKELSIRIRELQRRGVAAIGPLPTSADMLALPEEQRVAELDGLRSELYAVSSLLAEAVVARAEEYRVSYPPYGLAKSLFTETRMVADRPDPFEAGEIDNFFLLWRAFVDTGMFHVHQAVRLERRENEWLPERMRRLLKLFDTTADAKTRLRQQDEFSFLFGGLQFGMSVSIQFTEVMARVLADQGLSAAQTAEVIGRSVGTANQLAAMNFQRALPAYQRLLLAADPDNPRPGDDAPGWLNPAYFEIEQVSGAPYRIGFRDEEAFEPADAGSTTTFSTLGCPARTSASGGQTPIAVVWHWCVQIAHDTGLLGPVEAPPADDTVAELSE